MADSPITSIDVGDVVEGRYKILKPIGEGGMGMVFLAEHWLIKRRVAIKILHKEFARDKDMVRRFMNEALAAGTLGHPNIVESTDMGFAGGDVPYIVYEYVEGTLLSDEIYRVQEMPIRRIIRIAWQIAAALDAVHAAHIVHRDLKTDNIFLTDREQTSDHVKVLDFGISRFASADSSDMDSMTMGTPEFMAPEQVTHPDAVDARADIYALGVVMYEMLTRRLPFFFGTDPGPSRQLFTPNIEAAHALLRRIVYDPPPPLIRHDAPPGLAEMIMQKLLAKDPAKRYQSMKELQGALEAFNSVMPRTKSASWRPEVTPVEDLEPLSPQSTSLGKTATKASINPVILQREVKTLGKRWALDGNDLRLEVGSLSVAKLALVVTQAGLIADDMDIQPLVIVEPPRLYVTLRAHDGKALTVADLVFAARLEQWMRETPWRG